MAFTDPDLPRAERITNLVSQLTLDEKIARLCADNPAVDRLGIPAYDWWNECLHGVARSGLATVFPQAIGLGATFDPDLVGRVAAAIADEARAKHHAAVREGKRLRYQGLTFWTPNINIFRDPRWGRGQETYGEDPYLTGMLGEAFVRSLQEEKDGYIKAAACAKHFAVHSGPEKLRHEFDAVAASKDVEETYLPAFKRLVDAGVEAVMGAYNRTNGEACCASETLLGKTLRGAWGFAGHVVSDCGAVSDFYRYHKITKDAAESAAMALKAGCDLNCGDTFRSMGEALERGLVSETDIDRAVTRLLNTQFKLGFFDPEERVPFAKTSISVIHSESHVRLAHEAAAGSIVLVKNNGVLPLSKSLGSLYVTGPNAVDMEALFGNYYGVTPHMPSILEGIVRKVSPTTQIEYRKGCLLDSPAKNPRDWTSSAAAASDAVIAVMGLSQLLEGEEGDSIASESYGDREDIGLPSHQLAFLRGIKEQGATIVTVLLSGSAIASPELHELSDALLYGWYPGEQGGVAIGDVIFGDVSPSGKLPVTVPRSVDDLPPFTDYSMAGRTYRYMEKEPLYPFGFGLSYGNVEIAQAVYLPETRSVRVTMMPAYATKGYIETVQIYAAKQVAGLTLPRHELCGLVKVRVPAYHGLEGVRRGGDTSRPIVVEVPIDESAFSYVDDSGSRNRYLGELTLTVGCSSPSPVAKRLGAPEPVELVVSV